MRIHPNILSENFEMDEEGCQGGRNDQHAPGGQREGGDPGCEEEPGPDRGPDLYRAEVAAGEQEQQVSSDIELKRLMESKNRK